MSKKQGDRTELELRVELARRRDDREQKIARSLCGVDSEHCRAGDEWEWFDVTSAVEGRTYCFCPAHALAAELLAGTGLFFDASTPPEIIAKIHAVEQQREREKAGHG